MPLRRSDEIWTANQQEERPLSPIESTAVETSGVLLREVHVPLKKRLKDPLAVVVFSVDPTSWSLGRTSPPLHTVVFMTIPKPAYDSSRCANTLHLRSDIEAQVFCRRSPIATIFPQCACNPLIKWGFCDCIIGKERAECGRHEGEIVPAEITQYPQSCAVQHGHHPQSSIGPKSALAIVPPKKVIKALYDYTPQNRNGQELAFNKGDFFHVLSRESDTEWYEACNPLIPDARGLVPVAYFEVIGKQQRTSGNSVGSSAGHDSGFSENGKGARVLSSESQMSTAGTMRPSMQHARAPSSAKSGAMVYGIVLYDFNAERPDELDAKMGEAIIVVAQSNPEWFVAKPIGRLGGPGLIPVSFIDIKDTVTGQSVTDPLEAVRKAGVPRVEEWKKTAADYKNSSISLGKLDQPQQALNTGIERMSIQQTRNPTPGQAHYANAPLPQVPQSISTIDNSQPLAPVQASVPRYCFDNDMYWYIIECQMEDGRWWELSRYYADFYDFQVALLEAFPEEAGNRGKPRTVPFMPGPVAHVTDAISNGRRQNLDDYIKKIVAMPPHISKSALVRNLFKPKPGQDFEIDPTALGEDYRLSNTSQNSLQRTHTLQSDGGQQPHGGMPPPGQRPKQSYSGGAGERPPLLHTQASTLTQGSGTSSIKQSNAGGALKIKVFFGDDIVTMRVVQDISFQALKEKVKERLRVNGDIRLHYKDEASNQLVQMETDDNLEHAIAVNSKLQIHVTYAANGA
ncbi:hypothetical protein R6Q59_009899 [Mikania micrantha]